MATVEQIRGDIVEAVHPWSAVAVSADDGAVRWRAGPLVRTAWRSASKPFQLATSLEALGDPALTDGELAVGAASHSGEPVHLRLVEGLLRRFGLAAEGLRCGAHPPMHVPSADAVLRAGGVFTDLHNNCSGKHAFMLAAAAANGWPLDYRPADHPLQRRNRARLEALCGEPAEVAVDGCGVPTFGFSLAGLARAWAALAFAMATEAGRGAESVADSVADRTLGRIGWAMARHPELTSGTGRFDLAVARSAREPMAVKIGAMGVFCLALPERRLGMAVKVHSGVSEALPVAVAETLRLAAPGSFAPPADWAPLVVRNVAGAPVGRLRPGEPDERPPLG